MTSSAVLSWSGGKDSSLALQSMLCAGHERVPLLTSVTTQYDRISIHAVRTSLLREQARALGQTLLRVDIPASCSNNEYEAALKTRLLALRTEGVRVVFFGDLFLEDVRAYRERLLNDVEMTARFPLWRRDTAELARSFVDQGWRAIVVSLDPDRLSAGLCGSEFDHDFLDQLPRSADPCGENGEFHTFVYDGPIFRFPVNFRQGPTFQCGSAIYTDLIIA